MNNHPSVVQIKEDYDEGQECFIITTTSATYYYQKRAGGFSSLHDCDGIDWINFKPEKSTRIARGIPNMVWPDNIGHPGHYKVQSKLEKQCAILSVSDDGLWKWRWSFTEHTARLDVMQTDSNRKYWFLYEGIHSGCFDPERSYWGTEKHGRRHDTPIWPDGNPPPFHDRWRATYFGFKGVPRVLYAIIHTQEAPLNLFSYMGVTKENLWAADGMTVFGFGRNHGPTPLLEGPKSFTIGFLETQDHSEIIQHLEEEFL